jgi:nucleotide-binding universal stress UspA family protein
MQFVDRQRKVHMKGTIVCGVSESPETQEAVELARALAARLGLRLVLVAVVDGIPPGTEESLTARQQHAGTRRTLDDVVRSVGDGAEGRVVVGERAEALARVAAEEGADVIVVGSRAAGFAGRNLRSRLARELEASTPVPVLVAPPATRKRSAQRLAAAAEAVAR